MFDEPVCVNCDFWKRTGSGFGYCTNEKSEEYERVVRGNHMCLPPFRSKM